MGREAIEEPAGTPIELAMTGDVLAIDHRLGSNITLDSFNPREEYLKSDPVE